MNFRIVEEFDNGEKIITYFQISESPEGYFWNYRDQSNGPFENVDQAVDSAYQTLIPVSE